MKRILLCLVAIGILILCTSCGEDETYVSGITQYQNTTIKYLFLYNDHTLTLTAEGDAPTYPIQIKYMTDPGSEVQGAGLFRGITSITTTPYRQVWLLDSAGFYSLWLICQQDTIGLGQW